MHKMENNQIIKLLNYLTYIDDDLWAIEYTDSYYLDDILKFNDISFFSVLKYLSKKQGIPLKKIKIKNKSKGFMFNVRTVDQNNVLAHNFDYQNAPCLILWTAPQDGLKSMSLVNPSILFNGLLNSKKFNQKKLLYTLLSPYTCMSGVNEAGLSITGISDKEGIVKQKNGQNVITPYVAIRAILDKCSTIEEAIDFLNSYDMYETEEINYNYQILDKFGNCILVRYVDNKLSIERNIDEKGSHINFVTSYSANSNIGMLRTRLTNMLLEDKKNEIKARDILRLLSNTATKASTKLSLFKAPIFTLWSALYSSNDKSLSVCFRLNYEIMYRFSLNNPGEFLKYNLNMNSEVLNLYDMTKNDSNIVLKANNVSKSYGIGDGRVNAISNINLKIKKGELLVIIGNSGSGKSTLLNILGGMDKPDYGKIYVNGNDISEFDDNMLTKYRKENIGFIFQSFNLINELTALENVLLTLENEDKNKAIRLLDMVGLAGKYDRYPANLSGGEQQRVSIARAIAKDPKILFCDEPTGSLDYETGKQILVELEKMARQQKKTVVIVTHTREIEKMADRVIYIKNGKIENVVINSNPVSATEIEW